MRTSRASSKIGSMDGLAGCRRMRSSGSRYSFFTVAASSRTSATTMSPSLAAPRELTMMWSPSRICSSIMESPETRST